MVVPGSLSITNFSIFFFPMDGKKLAVDVSQGI